jgi:protein kinase A
MAGVAVIRLKQVEHVRNERNVLAKVAGHPFITTMVASFQSLESLYMVVCTCPFASERLSGHG